LDQPSKAVIVAQMSCKDNMVLESTGMQFLSVCLEKALSVLPDMLSIKCEAYTAMANPACSGLQSSEAAYKQLHQGVMLIHGG